VPRIRSIAILMHERQRDAEAIQYRIWPIAEGWRRRGIRVEVVYGIDRPVDADLLVPHVDCSYIDDDYWAVITRHPRALNTGIRDIRKRAISANLVTPGDGWDGPVIVKTDGNCGGLPDHLRGRRGGPTLADRVRRRASRHPWVEERSFGWTRTLTRYYIYESSERVPRGAYRNEHVVVERYLPERDGERYVLRCWAALGSSGVCQTLTGDDPYVKARGAVRAACEAPAEIAEVQRRVGLDYGKMDFVLREGRVVLLDVNTTPTLSGDARSEAYVEQCAGLVRGIEAWEG